MQKLEFSVTGHNVTTYTFEVADELQSVLIDSFTAWVNRVLEKGVPITDGQVLFYGWTQIKCQVSQSHLQLLAPDGKSVPLQWSSNLTSALDALVYHQFVPESFGLVRDIPLLSDTVLVGERFAEIPMFLTRSEKSGENDSHSGWFMASLAHDADIAAEENLKIMSLYEAVVSAPHIFKYISMPVGSQVVFDNKTPTFYYQSKLIEPLENSLVAAEQSIKDPSNVV